MQEFDARNPPVRYAPRVLICAAGLAALALSWQLTVRNPQSTAGPAALNAHALNSRALAALQNEAFAQAEAEPGFTIPEQVLMRIAPGETFQQAVMRLGVGPREAAEAARAIGAVYDTVHVRAGLAFQAAVARPRDRSGPARLIGLSMRTGPASVVTLSRSFDGALRIRELDQTIHAETTVAEGRMTDSLYASALAAGATPELTAQVVKLFSHELDFSRDIHPGDAFRLVFDRKVSDSGRTIQTGDLLYAEIGARGRVTRFYRFRPAGAAEAEYFDGAGRNIRAFLLRTPLDGAHVTSGFGMRLHPILGYTRMHTGIDFGAPIGTPVLAAGDGVVKEARWAEGYGRWLEIQHQGQWATGYGHLSGWAVRPGEHVRQGQVVGFVGSTGRSTGPHLHYEVIFDGRKINPIGAKVPQGTALGGRELVAFEAEKARIDRLLEGGTDLGEPRLAKVDLPRPAEGPGGLRLAMR